MNIGEDGIVSDGIVIADIYRLMDCEKYPELVVSKVYQGADDEVSALISLLMEPSMGKEISKLPQKRHCQACNKLIDIKSGQKKRYCDGSKCRQAAFMLRKQVLETGEWCGDVFKFSHKGQLKGGKIIPMEDNIFKITYLDGEMEIKVCTKNFSKKKCEIVFPCFDVNKDHTLHRLSYSGGGKFHIGKAASIVQGFLEKKHKH